MNFKLLIIGVLLWVSYESTAQKSWVLTARHADCDHAIDISGLTQFDATAPSGAGKADEVATVKGDLMYFEKEHNVVWYRFTVDKMATLSLVITPEISTDDYDFILFESPVENPCQSIQSKELKPVRTNISRANDEVLGRTGLGNTGQSAFVHEGKGNNYSLPLPLKVGSYYFLVLDNVYGGEGGHHIVMDYASVESVSAPKVNKPMLNVTVVDNASHQMIEANLKLIQFDKDYKADTILIQKSSSLFYPLQSETYYTVKVNGLNYLSQEESFKVSPKDTLISLVMEMQNVTIGTLFELKKVYFTGGTANFTGNSSSALRKLVQTLKDNPNLKVEIQGHVNLPKGSYRKKTEEYYNQLSIDRAKAVYDYLIMRGIEIDRLEYQGYGYSKMVFPEATTADEMQQNRRVELKVIDN